jgi:mono/diheme cytochrome c family protein
MSADRSVVQPTRNPMALDRGESTDVISLHAAVSRERPEPIEGMEPVSLWLVVFIAALLFWAGSYLTQYSGGFRADEFNEGQINVKPPPSRAGVGDQDPAARLAAQGALVYNANCMPCHQSDGNGLAGQFPPLAGSEWVLAEGPNRLIRIVLHGLEGPITVKGNTYNLQMNAFGEVLSDTEISAVLTYIRNTWGNKASVVTKEEVTAVRGSTAGHSGYWTVAQLEEVPETGGATPVTSGTDGAALSLDDLRALLEGLSADERTQLLQSIE